jgi:hypothetical protein
LIAIRAAGTDQIFDYALSLAQSPVTPRSDGTNQHLAIFTSTNHCIIRWETNSSGFILETSPSLGASWSPVAIPSRIIADHFYVDLGAPTNGYAFHRLRCTNCP